MKQHLFVWKCRGLYKSSETAPTIQDVGATEILTLSRLIHFDPPRSLIPRNAKLCAVHHEGRVLEFVFVAHPKVKGSSDEADAIDY